MAEAKQVLLLATLLVLGNGASLKTIPSSQRTKERLSLMSKLNAENVQAKPVDKETSFKRQKASLSWIDDDVDATSVKTSASDRKNASLSWGGDEGADLPSNGSRIINGYSTPDVLAKYFGKLSISSYILIWGWWKWYVAPATCGGSVLDKRRILTAAHCVVEPGYYVDVSKTKVYYGTNSDIKADVHKIFIYKDYDEDDAPWHDLAILELKEDMSSGDYSMVTPYFSFPQGSKLFSMGFGYTSNYGSPSDELLMTDFTSYGYRDYDDSVDDSTMGSARGPGYFCTEDSGGPVFRMVCDESGCMSSSYFDEDVMYLAGIVSASGNPCDETHGNKYMWFTDLFQYRRAVGNMIKGDHSDWTVLS